MNAAVPCAQPLYLHTGSAQRLDIDAANRLRIESRQQAMRHIPLHHVSRIVCQRSLDISARALMACMDGGVPVVILDRHGQTVGWCLGHRRRETSMRQLLLHGLEDPQWTSLYALWLRDQAAACAAQNMLLCGVRATPAARRSPRVALCNAHYEKHGQACADALEAIAELARAEWAQALLAQASDPALLAWNRPGLNLLADLGNIVAMHAHTDLHHVNVLPTAQGLERWAIGQYEAHAAHWQQRIAHLLVAFEQFLRHHWQ